MKVTLQQEQHIVYNPLTRPGLVRGGRDMMLKKNISQILEAKHLQGPFMSHLVLSPIEYLKS